MSTYLLVALSILLASNLVRTIFRIKNHKQSEDSAIDLISLLAVLIMVIIKAYIPSYFFSEQCSLCFFIFWILMFLIYGISYITKELKNMYELPDGQTVAIVILMLVNIYFKIKIDSILQCLLVIVVATVLIRIIRIHFTKNKLKLSDLVSNEYDHSSCVEAKKMIEKKGCKFLGESGEGRHITKI